jgi:hypothetical protein
MTEKKNLPWIITKITRDGRTINYLQHARGCRWHLISGARADELLDQGEARVLTSYYEKIYEVKGA